MDDKQIKQIPDHWIPLTGEGKDFGVKPSRRGVELAWDCERDILYITKIIENDNG